MKYKEVFLGLGSNISDKKKNLENALAFLSANNKINIVKTSKIYESLPWGYKMQENFYNQVIKIETNLEPHELLIACKKIEKQMGRQTTIKWGPRNIDIDILLFDDILIKGDFLNIPHRYLTKRCFWLIGLAEIERDLRVFGESVENLIEREPDRDSINVV